MAKRPGWYPDPAAPASMRYWDGARWARRTRSRPPWAVRNDEFEFDWSEADRSVEGPVHPHELREPVFSGAREWLLPGRARQSQGWRQPSGARARSFAATGWQPPPKLGSARRPLLIMACMIVVAVAVVISSVAVMTPYRAPGTVEIGSGPLLGSFAAQASRDCQATLPRYRAVLADDLDGPSIAAAVRQLDLLRLRLSAVRVAHDLTGSVQEWLQTWANFSADQRRYAAIIGPATRLDGHLVPRPLPSPARQAAVVLHRRAVQQASLADRFSGDLRLDTCRLEQSPAL